MPFYGRIGFVVELHKPLKSKGSLCSEQLAQICYGVRVSNPKDPRQQSED